MNFLWDGFLLVIIRILIDRLELEDIEFDFEGVRFVWNKVEILFYYSDEELLLYMVEMSELLLDEWRSVVIGLFIIRYRVIDLLLDRDYRFRVRVVILYGMIFFLYVLFVFYRRLLFGMCVYNKVFFFIKK